MMKFSMGTMCALALTVVLGGVGCSSGGKSTPATADNSVTISGKLGGVSSSSIGSLEQSVPGRLNVAFTDLEVYGVAFTTPPAISTVAVNADGSFSLNLPNAKGAAITMIFRHKTELTEVGVVVFKDDSKKGLNGQPKEQSSVVLNGSVSLGNINIQNGKVVVNVADIATVVAPATPTASVFDFNGVWKAAAYSAKPSGYATATPNCGNDGACVPEGFPVSLIRIVGKEFTPNANTCDIDQNNVTCAVGDGQVGTADKYAISIWGGDAATGSAIQACGYKMGFTEAEARAGGRLHPTAAPSIGGNAMTFARFTYAAPSGWGGNPSPYNQAWMKDDARAKWPVNDCTPVVKTGTDNKTYNFFACRQGVNTNTSNSAQDGSDGSDFYYFWAHEQAGGCVDANGKPLRVEVWNNTPVGNCNVVDHPGVAGVKVTTCNYNAAPRTGATAQQYSCTFSGGAFTASNMNTAAVVPNGAQYPIVLVAQNSFCKDVPSDTEGRRLAAFQCFANAYWENEQNLTGCLPRYRFNYAATTTANFVQTNDRDKPDDAFVTDIVSYSADGQTFFVNNEQNETGVVQTGSGSVVCDVQRSIRISGKALSSTQLLFEIVQGGRLLSIDKPACRAAAASTDPNDNNDIKWMVQGEKLMFLLNKQ